MRAALMAWGLGDSTVDPGEVLLRLEERKLHWGVASPIYQSKVLGREFL
jgi:hypothetical protein